MVLLWKSCFSAQAGYREAKRRPNILAPPQTFTRHRFSHSVHSHGLWPFAWLRLYLTRYYWLSETGGPSLVSLGQGLISGSPVLRGDPAHQRSGNLNLNYTSWDDYSLSTFSISVEKTPRIPQFPQVFPEHRVSQRAQRSLRKEAAKNNKSIRYNQSEKGWAGSSGERHLCCGLSLRADVLKPSLILIS